jgi:hypothetical protein
MREALMTLQRQIDLVAAEIRITDRQIHKAEPDSEPLRAASTRRDILDGKLAELNQGLKKLQS